MPSTGELAAGDTPRRNWRLIAWITVLGLVTIAIDQATKAWAVSALSGREPVGNLLDRLFRDPGFPEGAVVDFIDYGGWFVGNVADIAIVLAVGLIALLTLRGVRVDGSRHPATQRSG